MSDLITLDGKVAIVTGAANGLGKSHALDLARRGALVVVNDIGGSVDGSGGSAAAQLVVDEIEAAGGTAVADRNSVSTPKGAAAIIQRAIDTFGAVHILVNNAGILRDQLFHKMSIDEIDSVIATHLSGSLYVSHAVWPHMREQEYGRIINVTSESGLFGNAAQANYAAAKGGLYGLTRALAVEGVRKSIKVNAIAPVGRTRMTEPVFQRFGIPEDLDLGARLITPVVSWLASDECHETGNAFLCGGGRVARIFMGVTPGFVDPNLTAESIRDHMDEIYDEQGFEVPCDLTESLGTTMAAIGAMAATSS